MTSRKQPKSSKPWPTPADRERGLVLLEAGESISAIAREVGVLRLTVRAWRDSPEGRARMTVALDARARDAEAQRAARARANQIICEATVEAAHVLRDALRSPDHAARIRAADSLLDRGGAPKSTKVDATVTPGVDLSKLTDDEAAQLEALAAKAAP